jgi:hypothetical protein
VPIRIATATLFLVATAVSVFAPVPDELPVIALGQAALYRVEILLALVYAGLLLLTPLFYGVFHGRLPIELSHRGAKWESGPSGLENADQQVEELEVERAQLLRERRQLEAAAEVGAGRRRQP